MADPFIGECRLVGFNFAPVDWNICDGSLQQISQYDTLFTLIGTTYGGDGQQTFALPDLRGRVPVHRGGKYVIGAVGGAETVTLDRNTMPPHTHSVAASPAAGTANLPARNLLAANANVKCYLNASAVDTAMAPAAISSSGGSLAHENMQPFLAMNWVISLYGIFPAQQ